MRKEQQVDDSMFGAPEQVHPVGGLGQKGDEDLTVEHREVVDTYGDSDLTEP